MDSLDARPRGLARFAAAILLLPVLTGGVLTTATANAAGQQLAQPAARGRAMAIPQPGNQRRQLQGVTCVSATDCWAVGWYFGAHSTTLSEALHWNGRTWSQAVTPNPGVLDTALQAVTCSSAADCWAVGSATNGISGGYPTPVVNVAMHWNGRTWSLVRTPDPAGTGSGHSNSLQGVACVSATDCWAAGSYGGAGRSPRVRNEALHWNGRRWSAVAAPDRLRSNRLVSVNCVSANDCWAVGSALGPNPPCCGTELEVALHWDGQTWSQVSTPQPGRGLRSLTSISCTSSARCSAVGNSGGVNDAPILNQALRWNGQRWTVVATPDPSGTVTRDQNFLQAAACTSARNCWAVGFDDTDEFDLAPIENQALRWNGSAWSQVPTPEPGGTVQYSTNRLYGVTCSSAANCWAVGSFAMPPSAPDHNLMNDILHWNGVSWSAS